MTWYSVIYPWLYRTYCFVEITCCSFPHQNPLCWCGVGFFEVESDRCFVIENGCDKSGLDCEKDVTRVVVENNSTDVEKSGKEHLCNVTYGYIWGGVCWDGLKPAKFHPFT